MLAFVIVTMTFAMKNTEKNEEDATNLENEMLPMYSNQSQTIYAGPRLSDPYNHTDKDFEMETDEVFAIETARCFNDHATLGDWDFANTYMDFDLENEILDEGSDYESSIGNEIFPSAERRSKLSNKLFHNGHYKSAEEAARASDELAITLMDLEEDMYELNFKASEKICADLDCRICHAEAIEPISCSHRCNNNCMKNLEDYGHKNCPLCRNRWTTKSKSEKGARLRFVKEKCKEKADILKMQSESSKPSKHIGVAYNARDATWSAGRWSKILSAWVCFGYYGDEETAAHASDTLARILLAHGERDRLGLQLNFPNDATTVYPEENTIFGSSDRNVDDLLVAKIGEDEYIKIRDHSKYFGVSYNEKRLKWNARRWSTVESKNIYNGSYSDEERAAHASDTLARKLIAGGEQGHKLNFPDDHTEVNPERRTVSKYVGVTYDVDKSKWCAQRRSEKANELVCNGYYENEKTAAYASDTLARKLTIDGEQGHELNFPNDDIEVPYRYIGVTYCSTEERWSARRWSTIYGKTVENGLYSDEETAAHASDTLARKLIERGEHDHELNFPDVDLEFTDDETEERNELNVLNDTRTEENHQQENQWLANLREQQQILLDAFKSKQLREQNVAEKTRRLADLRRQEMIILNGLESGVSINDELLMQIEEEIDALEKELQNPREQSQFDANNNKNCVEIQKKCDPENKKYEKCGEENFTDGEKCERRKRKRSDSEFED